MKKKIVYVGISGGVDSSVSAALLIKAGFDVRGVFIKVWQPNISLTGGCTWREDRLDAMRICAKLQIPFYMLNLEKEYKKEVVDYMIHEYKSGRTPNPDVMCNKYIKFGGFFNWAMKNRADYVATGHYARINMTKNGKFQLLAGSDNNKDQSYFLWTLTQKQLAKTLFPIGNIKKPKVRNIAKKFGLITSEKKDSQGLCFIGKVNMLDFLKKFIKTKPGKVLNEKGKVVGTHQGSELYTIGQRHGLVINRNNPHSNRSFITSKDIVENTITVSDDVLTQNNQPNKEFILTDINWTLGIRPKENVSYQARIRYRGSLDKCRLNAIDKDNYKITFTLQPKAPAKGQSVVIYDKNVCLGGGIIN